MGGARTTDRSKKPLIEAVKPAASLVTIDESAAALYLGKPASQSAAATRLSEDTIRRLLSAHANSPRACQLPWSLTEATSFLEVAVLLDSLIATPPLAALPARAKLLAETMNRFKLPRPPPGISQDAAELVMTWFRRLDKEATVAPAQDQTIGSELAEIRRSPARTMARHERLQQSDGAALRSLLDS